MADHRPPRAVGIPWALSAAAISLRLVAPDALMSATIGAKSAARLSALAFRIFTLASQPFGYRIPRQLARVLERLEISCPWGGYWSAAKADRLLQHHAGEWMVDVAGIRLRHGGDALKLEGFPELPALERRRGAPPALPAAVVNPQKAISRRRAVRIS